MSKIDWSKAPEWATEVGENGDYAWMSADGYCYCHVGSIADIPCHPFGGGNQLREAFTVISCRPWNGEGLPPVGVKAEVVGLPEGGLPKSIEDWKNGDEVECVAHHVMQGDDVTPVFFNKRTLQFSGLRKDCYRPIRTPEQIAAEERERQLDQMVSAAGMLDKFWARKVAERLYDVGYRK